MMSVIHIKQGQGIRHASLLDSILPVSSPVGREAEYLICEDNLLVCPLQVFNLRVDVEQLI